MINVPKGEKNHLFPIKIDSFSEYHQEEEVMLPAGTVLRIKDVKGNLLNNPVIINLEYIPAEKKYKEKNAKKLVDMKLIDVKGFKIEQLIQFWKEVEIHKKTSLHLWGNYNKSVIRRSKHRKSRNFDPGKGFEREYLFERIKYR